MPQLSADTAVRMLSSRVSRSIYGSVRSSVRAAASISHASPHYQSAEKEV
jgi:hypothetical protein